MEHEDTRRPGLMGYDEKSETWYLRSAETQRLMLTRQSLAHLVEMYNTVHTGRPMVLIEERDLRHLRELRRRSEETLFVATPAPRLRERLARLASGIRRRLGTGRR
jgi:hypothetical protein